MALTALTMEVHKSTVSTHPVFKLTTPIFMVGRERKFVCLNILNKAEKQIDCNYQVESLIDYKESSTSLFLLTSRYLCSCDWKRRKKLLHFVYFVFISFSLLPQFPSAASIPFLWGISSQKQMLFAYLKSVSYLFTIELTILKNAGKIQTDLLHSDLFHFDSG